MAAAPPALDSEPALSADCIVVGAGFSGCYATHMLRKQGYTVKIIDAGSDFGGVWHSHRYPGALVDSPSPLYQLSLPEAWQGFHFRTKFPDQREMQAYFQHVGDVLDLRRDAVFRHAIVDARHDAAAGVWRLRSDRGLHATGRYVFFATGTTNKPHVPAFPGRERFRGRLVHTHDWPADLSLREARRIALIGVGSTGTQVAQEIAKLDHAEVTVFTRTPNIAYPLRQETCTVADAERRKAAYAEVFPQAKAAGWPRYLVNTPARRFHEDAPARRREVWEAAWRKGGFAVFLENYPEVATDRAANAAFYEFWKEKTRPRIRDPAKRAALVPDEQPVCFMARRPVLEADYYEMMDRANVTLVDLRRTPIREFTADGLVTADADDGGRETRRAFDLVICATGYDAVTGSLYDMNVRDRRGALLQDRWRDDGIATHMGMMVPGLPNAFLLYGPQAPGPMTNGPTFIEVQVELLCRLLARAEDRGMAEVEATEEAARRWRDKVYEGYRATLASEADSWWVGTNVPGKRREPLTWFAGVPAWREACEESLRSWDDFEPARADAKL